ncbi:MAG: DNA (cytosine-5-)-methyltransferase, partial [Nitrospinae bacterium CG11_big_fil_rev_8_21_14_0_20_56_8]
MNSNFNLGSNVILKLGELFCGPGGIGLGAKWACLQTEANTYRLEHSWAVDIDKDSCETYRNNICPDVPESVICQDVRSLDFKSLPTIDAFAFGFPCNDFSIVGEKNGINGKFGPLYTYGVKVIEHFKPKFFVAENVGGISSSNEGNCFKKILYDLEQSGNGYNLSTHYYKFEEYGIPQARHRFIIVGIDKSLDLYFHPPKPSFRHKPKSVKDALENPPIPQDSANQEPTKQSRSVIERLKFIKPGENAWNAQLPTHLKLNVKGARLSQIYKRLDPSKPAYTLTGSGGGGTPCYHWKEPRALTNRERARIQTFPDDFVFFGSKEKVRKQLGM